MLSVLIDSREPPDIQAIDFGVPSGVMALEAGDVMITCDDGSTLVIERKTPGDLLGSIKDGRLFQQAHAMRELSEFCYVAVIGRMDNVNGRVRIDGCHNTEWGWGSVQGSLLTIQELGVGVVYGLDFKATVERLARRSRDDITIHPRRKSEPMTADETFLASLPGIGAIKAKKFLSQGTASQALYRLTNLWGEDDVGLGWNQRVKIRDILGLRGKYKEFLAIDIWENEKDE